MTPERYKNAADFLLAASETDKVVAIDSKQKETWMKIDLGTVELILLGDLVFSQPDILTLTEKGRRNA
jgi:hypothetical protein